MAYFLFVVACRVQLRVHASRYLPAAAARQSPTQSSQLTVLRLSSSAQRSEHANSNDGLSACTKVHRHSTQQNHSGTTNRIGRLQCATHKAHTCVVCDKNGFGEQRRAHMHTHTHRLKYDRAVLSPQGHPQHLPFSDDARRCFLCVCARVCGCVLRSQRAFTRKTVVSVPLCCSQIRNVRDVPKTRFSAARRDVIVFVLRKRHPDRQNSHFFGLH